MTTIREYLKAKQDAGREEYQRKINAHRRKLRIVVLAVLLAIGAAAVGVKIYLDNKSYSEYKITDTLEMNGTSNSRYYPFGGSLLSYTDDGISYIKDGETAWNQAFEMKSPIVDCCGDTMAICDLRTTTVYIYDTEGQKGKIETVYPVIDLEVSEQGVVAAITEDTETNRIEVLDKDGNAIAAGQTYITGEGCPIDISLSNDGTKLVASYIYVDGGTAKSKVVFYNYSEVGKNEVGRIVGGFNHYDTTIVSKVEFIDNDTAVAFGDKMFTIYSIRQKPEKKAEQVLEHNIKSIFYQKEYVGFVLDAESYDNPYVIKIYDADGDETANVSTDLNYTGISMGNEWIIMYNNDEMIMYTLSGRQRYRGSVQEGIRTVIASDKANRCYVINGEYNIMDVKLK